jgi:NDP-sugar pyrophosphorylase family protein
VEAIVLVGGIGTRLRPYTWILPKPLLPLGETSILEITLRRLAHSGFSKVTLAVGHKASFVRHFVKEIKGLPFEVEYLEELQPKGTAGFLFDYKTENSKVLVMNGDLLTDLNLEETYSQHNEEEYAASVVCVERKDKIDYGVIVSDELGNLAEYREKPELNYLVSSGIYVLSTRDIGNLNEKDFLTMPEALEEFIRSGRLVKIKSLKMYWMDLGRPDDYHEAAAEFENNPERFLAKK